MIYTQRPAHIAAHGLVPQVILGAGRGVRALLVDHKLLIVRVFLKLFSRGNVRFGLPPFVFVYDLTARS